MRTTLRACAMLILAAATLAIDLSAAPQADAGDAAIGRDGPAVRGGPGGAAAAGAAPAGGVLERTPEFLRSVSDAIDRGVAFLRTQEQPGGGFGAYSGYACGLNAIAYHTLRTCGLSPADPSCTATYEALRAEYVQAKQRGDLRTYSAGLMMLAVADHALTWTPDRSKRKTPPKRLVDERDRVWMNELVAYLENCQSTVGGWRYGQLQLYGKAPPSPDFDLSNTQYAAQGPRAAALLGCAVKTETWTRLTEQLVELQEPDGPDVRLLPKLAKGQTGAATNAKARGWGYRELYGADRRGRKAGRDGAYGSMTAGSLASLALARDELRGRSRVPNGLVGKCETGIRDGIGWLAANFDVTRNPGRGGWHLYYLYALERAGDLAETDWMGEHDWYREGAEQLLRMQDARGAWRESGPDTLGTCFALLFLRRAARGLQDVTPGAAEDAIHFDVAARLTGKDFEDFVDLIVSRWWRVGSAEARDDLAAGAASVGEHIVLPLLVRMDAPDADARRAAAQVLQRITGLGYPFDPDAAPAVRARQLMEYEAWTLSVAGKLGYDRGLGRLTLR